MLQSVDRDSLDNRRKKSAILSQISTLSLNQLLPLCITILQKPQDQRKSEELQIIQVATQEIKFFKSVLYEQGEQIIRECLKRMSIEMKEENDVVIEQGDKAKDFYVILNGTVSVYVFKNLFNESNQFDQAYWIKNRQFLVSTLYTGESFGEVALLNDSLRTASVICDCHCTFAVLSKKDYKDVLQKAQEIKLRQQIKDFHSCMKYHQISPKLLDILFFAFQSTHYQFRQSVYLQGNICKQEIFLIQSGEFIIFKNAELGLSPRKMNSPIALLQKGAIFGDHESFHNVERRQQSVFCNSEHGTILKIQLSCLIQRLQTTNEMHLYDQLKNACLQREHVREERQQRINTQDTNVSVDMTFVKQRKITFQVARVRSARRNTFSIRTPLQKVEDVVQKKKQAMFQGQIFQYSKTITNKLITQIDM